MKKKYGVMIDQTPQGIILSICPRHTDGEGFLAPVKQYRCKSLEQAKAYVEKTYNVKNWIPIDKYTPKSRLAWTIIEM